MAATKHIPIDAWLKTLNLSEYLSTFKDYNGVEDILHLTEADVRNMGIKNSSHRACLVTSLVMLRKKLNKTKKQPVPTSSLYSSPVYQTFSSVVQETEGYSQSKPHNSSPSTYGTYPGRSPHSKSPLASNLDTTPLTQFPWYHKNIPRDKAEKLVGRNGDFLIRDSISNPGDYVLTCCWEGTPLHFMVNKKIVNEGTPTARTQYLFEEDFFCNIPDLINFHVTHKKPISLTSGAIISSAVNRFTPMDYFDIRPSAMRSKLQGMGAPIQASKTLPRPNRKHSPISSPVLARKILHRRTGSQPLLSSDDDSQSEGAMERHGSLPSIGSESQDADANKIQEKQSNTQLYDESGRSGSEPSLYVEETQIKHPKKHMSMQQKSTASIIPCSNVSPPPPKPSRVPSIKLNQREKPVVVIRNAQLYEEEDGDYSDYEMLKAQPSGLDWDDMGHVKTHYSENDKKDKVMKAPKSLKLSSNNKSSSNNESTMHQQQNGKTEEKVSPSKLYAQVKRKPKLIITGKPRNKPSATCNANEMSTSQTMASEDYDRLIEVKKPITIPNLNAPSDIDAAKFTSEILPAENKPLDSETMVVIKSLLLETDAKCLACHMTRVDLEQLKVVNNKDLGVGVTLGLELLTLPHGKQLREDILERYECMTKFVATTILTCTGYSERSKLIQKWILIAAELKGSMGNMLGFTAVIDALQLLQVTRLKTTWASVRDLDNNTANMLDTKLKPHLLNLNNANINKVCLPQKCISIPHLLPVVLLLQRDEPATTDLLSWELKNVQQGFDTLLAHLEDARLITQHLDRYRLKAEEIVKNITFTDKLLDLFRTEFHLRLLWGSKGAIANQKERYIKFNQLLAVLSERAEPSQGFDQNSESAV